MKINLYHPNGDIHEYELDEPLSVDDLVSDLEFELTKGCAEWVGISKAGLPEKKQNTLMDRVQKNLEGRR